MRKLIIFFVTALSLSQPVAADILLSSEAKALLTAAKAGEAEAQYKLAVAYDWGQGAPRSGKKAKKWYLAAASQGHAEAQNSLGSALQAEGEMSEAFRWYRAAAAQEHPLAINNLAAMYDHGTGVGQDRQKAFELYTKSADLGETHAMWNLANTHGAGHLGERDVFLACVWTARAKRYAQTDDADLGVRIKGSEKYLAGKLSASQLSECSDQAALWSPKD